MMRKFLKIILWLLAGLLVLSLVVFLVFNKKNPSGQSGPEAEMLAQHLATAINKTAWDTTTWVKWTYANRNSFIWDRQNGQVQVKWGDVVVHLNTQDQTGTAMKKGKILTGESAQDALNTAWKWFCNDSFWLIAPAKIFDEGTQRSTVLLQNGRKGLKVEYTSGGVTPGDTYLWELNEQGLPVAFQMWVKILPIGGVSATWEDWVTLPTGAKISTTHKIGGLLTVRVTNLSGGAGQVHFDN